MQISFQFSSATHFIQSKIQILSNNLWGPKGPGLTSITLFPVTFPFIYFTMANNYMKKYSTSLFSIIMQFKVMRYHHKFKNIDWKYQVRNTTANLSHCWWKCKLQNHFEKCLAVATKSKHIYTWLYSNPTPLGHKPQSN